MPIVEIMMIAKMKHAISKEAFSETTDQNDDNYINEVKCRYKSEIL